MIKTRRLNPQVSGAITEAAALLRQGELVAFPTDTLYGVGCDAFNAEAIERLYAIKERPSEKGIPILLADGDDLDKVALAIPAIALTLIERFWPGPLTLIVPKKTSLPANLSPNEGIAVRLPAHQIARHLIREAGGAIATSSANVSGAEPARNGDEAWQALAGRVAAVVDGGPVRHGLSSTIVDCTVAPPRLIRPGPLSTELLRAAGLELS
jgi:L-threonylcarbamoyladenylate synthase